MGIWFFSQRLDRHRPLWEMALVEGLADGRWAIAHKTHHSIVDGVGSVDVGQLILDATADAGRAAAASSSAGSGASASHAPSRPADRPASAAHPSVPGRLASLAHAWAGLFPLETMVHAARNGNAWRATPAGGASQRALGDRSDSE